MSQPRERRRLTVPRVYSVEMDVNGKHLSKMLGVAFRYSEQQTFYTQFKMYKYWSRWSRDSGVSNVQMVSEELNG